MLKNKCRHRRGHQWEGLTLDFTGDPIGPVPISVPPVPEDAVSGRTGLVEYTNGRFSEDFTRISADTRFTLYLRPSDALAGINPVFHLEGQLIPTHR